MLWLRHGGVVVVAGLTAGLALGTGARLSMRTLALVMDRSPEISFEGTAGILIVSCILGTLLAVAFSVVRGALPGRGWRRGLLYGVLAFAALVPILGPRFSEEIDPVMAAGNLPLAVVGFGASFAVYGMLLEALLARLRADRPRIALEDGPQNRTNLAALFVLPALLCAGSASAGAANAGTIAYMRAGNEIRLIDPDGAHDHNLWTEPGFGYKIGSLAWRPDGMELAFSSDHERALSRYESDLFAIGPDGSSMRKITNAPASDRLAAYPTGSVKLSVGNGTADYGPFLLYLQGAQAAMPLVLAPGETTIVTLNDVADLGAVGQTVVAIDGNYRWVMPTLIDVQAGATVDGGTFLMQGDPRERYGAYAFSWREDSGALGFILGDCVQMYQVPVNPAAGGLNEMPLLNTQSVYPCLLDRGPTPALANQILYGVFGAGGGAIYRVDEGSSNEGELLYSYTTPDLLLSLQWLPDGSGFLFSQTSDFDVSSNIYEYKFMNAEVTPITHFTDELAGGFSLSPDGQSIVFERTATLGGAQIDLWLMQRNGQGMHKLVSDAQLPTWGRSAPAVSLGQHLFMPLLHR